MPASTSLLPSPLVLLVAALVTGCVIPKSVGEGNDAAAGSSDGTHGTAGSDAPPGSASSTGPGATGPASDGETDPSAGTTSGDTTGVDFIVMSDGGIFDPCDPWAQDCARGEKCTPAAREDDGTTWDWARCAPIVEDPGAPGEPCTVVGSPTSGIDTCELGAMCWDVDPVTLEGVCIGLCVAPEDAPTCAQEGAACIIANDGALPICLPTCDPVLQDCEPGQACHPFGDVFVCAPEGASPGGVGESCEDIAMCDAGLFCAVPELVPDCASNGCCTSLCDVTDPSPPCLPGQSCQPYYEPGTAPVGFENVGICALPV
jgi:hypothetical protein